MRRRLPAAAMGAALGLLVVAIALQPHAQPTAAERAETVAHQLRCPDCQGLSVADSPTGSAQEIRRQIDGLIAGGASDDEVRAHFVARYGDWILLAPSSPAAWIIPFAVVLAGTAALGIWLVARQRAPATAHVELAADERRRLHDEAEALDA